MMEILPIAAAFAISTLTAVTGACVGMTPTAIKPGLSPAPGSSRTCVGASRDPVS